MTAAGDREPIFTGREKMLVAALYAAIGAITVAGFGVLFFVSAHYSSATIGTASGVTFAGIGLTAYILGVRHGVDADHIAAIDNTTRKLLQEKKRPLAVGTWFSLGHSTIVVMLVVLLVFAAQAIEAQIPAIRTAGNLIGTAVSGTFLFLIGLINVVIVLEVYRIFQGLRKGEFNEAQLEEQLTRRGFMNRLFGGLFRIVETPRQTYPIGLLFGLGFDTATEVVLIAVTVTAAVTFPIYAVLVLPLLFTCGMVLVDTTDGLTMRFAYGWAFSKPIRKIYYNLTVTIISVLVAFAVGGIELLGIVAGELNLSGGVWTAVVQLSFEDLGFGIVGLFVFTWLGAMAYYRYRRFDEIPFGAPPPPAGTGG